MFHDCTFGIASFAHPSETMQTLLISDNHTEKTFINISSFNKTKKNKFYSTNINGSDLVA